MKLPLVLTGALLLAACAVGPDHAAPDVASLAPPSFRDSGAAPAPADWWRGFNDPALTRLVDDAITSNRTLRSADASMRAARAALGRARRDLAPTVRSEAQYRRGRTSASALGATIPALGGGDAFDDTNLFDAGLAASWELDFWGGVRRSVEAAKAGYDEATADYDSAVVLVTAEVSSAYVALRGAQRLLDIAERNQQTQQNTRDLTQSLFDAGRASRADLARAIAQFETTSASIPTFEAEIAAQSRRLAVLTGRQPEALIDELAAASTFPEIPAAAPVGDPGTIIRQRPDIRAAEHALAGATARIGVAAADLFPRVQFIGAAGASAARLSAYGSNASLDYGFGPSITWAALDLGRVRARIRQSEAEADGVLARYESTVLGALEETGNAFTALARERERGTRLALAAAESRDAAALAAHRYAAGIDSFIDVLDADRALFAAETEETRSHILALQNLIAVYKALGGGWRTGTTIANAAGG